MQWKSGPDSRSFLAGGKFEGRFRGKALEISRLTHTDKEKSFVLFPHPPDMQGLFLFSFFFYQELIRYFHLSSIFHSAPSFRRCKKLIGNR
jgi:hypothetical protein